MESRDEFDYQNLLFRTPTHVTINQSKSTTYTQGDHEACVRVSSSDASYLRQQLITKLNVLGSHARKKKSITLLMRQVPRLQGQLITQLNIF